jgi:hypothetical protein
MPNYVKGLVEESSSEKLKIRLMNNTVVEAMPRPEIRYMNLVLVAFDFSTNSVKNVFLPSEVPLLDSIPVNAEEREEETGDEEEFGNLLASKRLDEFD